MHPISVYVIYPYNLPFIAFYNKQGYNHLTSLNIGNTSIKIEKKITAFNKLFKTKLPLKRPFL